MVVYLGLGSNLGDRRAHLERALGALEAAGVVALAVSPVVETPAWLPENAPGDWNRPFQNLVVACRTDLSPEQLKSTCKQIQDALGRTDLSRWAPRPIDIDLLLWGDQTNATDDLRSPHPNLVKRNFVLSPLTAIAPGLQVPGQDETVLQLSRHLDHHLPLWMGILNLTPDSFSDGGRFEAWETLEPSVDEMVGAGVHILDVGAESTRPGARPLAGEEEWLRLQPVLQRLTDKFAGQRLRPLISVDTYHPEVADRALRLGVDIINDVTGLTNPEMIARVRDSDCDWIAMHNVSIPASKLELIPADVHPVETVEAWLQNQLRVWTDASLDINRIIFDPGVGFGKGRLQSLQLLRSCKRLRSHGLRLLVGHSRKPFMKSDAQLSNDDKDLITIGASLNLCAQGVDIIRVHDVVGHLTAYRGWSHLLKT